MKPLERLSWAAAELMAAHPPRMHDRNKQVVLDIACPPGAVIGGTIEYSRWPELPLPERFGRPRPGLIESAGGWFTYEERAADAGALEWHMNFADRHLFGYYAGMAFAQDEAQVAEHPVLASVREALLARRMPALTEEGGRATPVLVRGAERRVEIATGPDRSAGVEGLYGHGFATATEDQVARATRPLHPPTLSNILAIAAPAGGHGAYGASTIERIIATAYSGFRSAVVEATEHAGATGALIHTGYWGGGAFGGNRELLSLLQLIAAEAAGIDRLVFWTGSAGGAVPFERALRAIDELVPPGGIARGDLIAAVVGRGYAWGRSDGT